jgi:hypothetical protein
MAPRVEAKRQRPALENKVVDAAFDRLARHHALHTLVRGALPMATLKRLLKDAMPKTKAREMPAETWSSLAVGICLESADFGDVLAEALHERVGWDREPADMDEWWRAVRERPLEALWMAALSASKDVKKEFGHLASHCIENFRSSPDSLPPSWEYVEGLLDVMAVTNQDLRDAERAADDALRKYEVERERLDELRDELKRQRRELAELRAEVADRRREPLASTAESAPASEELRRSEDLERRLRKSEKEREHLHRRIERLEAAIEGRGAEEDAVPALVNSPATESEAADNEAALAIAADPNPRRRVMRGMLKKLLKKGKVGASHTHEDNVHRGVADHEKGLAKDAIELLYREGYFVPKPTATDPHVSIAPERVAEVKAIIAGEIADARLLRFLESE